jgi:ABC-2 type transport system ATP-binding protein
MLTMVQRIGTEFGISVLVCSHLLGEIERICTSLVAIDAGRLLRSASLSAMTRHQDVVMVELDEDVTPLAGRLTEAGLVVRREDRGLLVELAGEDTYDVIRDAVADLDLSLHRMERRRHQVADLFRQLDSVEARHAS